jgi:thioredoxin-like negative regulator of GroEL
MRRTILALLAICFFPCAGCLSSDHFVAPAPIIGEDSPNKDARVLVVFGAGWCKYCHRLESDIGTMNTDGMTIQMVDVDESPELKQKHDVKSLPTSILMVGGREVSRKVGYEKKEYSKWLDQNRNAK